MALTNTPDGRLVAQANELAVLRGLHRLGWLRTRDIAALVWSPWMKAPAGEPSLTPVQATASWLRMSQRTLRRLREARQVLRGDGPDGSVIYGLAQAGVRTLSARGFSAASAKDAIRPISSAYFRHRTIANEIAISAIVQGFRVSSEHETARGLWLGGREGIAGKIPDVLIQAAGIAWWVEVERSRKNKKDYARLVMWLGTVRRDQLESPTASRLLGKRLRWGRVIFVCTDAFRRKLLQDLAAAGWRPADIEALLAFSTALYQFEGQTLLGAGAPSPMAQRGQIRSHA